MAIVVPTITASEPHEYREQMERIIPFAERIHIDLADGVFTPNKLIDIKHIWWPVGVIADVHLMYRAVKPFIKELIKHKPNLVIVHAEASGNYYEISQPLHDAGIKVGVALLAETPVKSIERALHEIDHVLIFSGDLGHYGGHANTDLLSKVIAINKINPSVEIGWDGGINDQNALRLVRSGVDILNVGGAIARAPNPESAYDTLKALAEQK